MTVCRYCMSICNTFIVSSVLHHQYGIQYGPRDTDTEGGWGYITHSIVFSSSSSELEGVKAKIHIYGSPISIALSILSLFAFDQGLCSSLSSPELDNDLAAQEESSSSVQPE